MVLAQPTHKCALLCSRLWVSPCHLALIQDDLNRRRLLGSSSDGPIPAPSGLAPRRWRRTRRRSDDGSHKGLREGGEKGRGCKEYNRYFPPTNLLPFLLAALRQQVTSYSLLAPCKL